MSSTFPPSNSSSQLRVATYNLGLGFTRKLPDLVERCTVLSLDLIALQEIGNPALTQSTYGQYLLVTCPGLSTHEAGVGLLISQELVPRCRAYKRSSSGRLVGVVLELARGRRILVVSAYMPSGLDHSSTPDKIDLARQLYTEMLSWSRDAQQIIFMGDLNETLTAGDRYPRGGLPRARASSKPIHCLVDDNFTDVYRLRHPDALRSPGFTHFIDSLIGRCSRSRIDYIWTKGLAAASLLSIHIDRSCKLRAQSHHRLLWLELQLDYNLPRPSSRPIVTLQLLDLRDITSEQRQELGHAIDDRLTAQQDRLRALSQTSLTSFAHSLTSIIYEAAASSLPVMGGKPMQSKSILTRSRERRDFTRLLRMGQLIHQRGGCATSSPEWVRLHMHCQRQHSAVWSVNPHTDFVAWCGETHQLIRRARSLIAKEQHRFRLKPAHNARLDVHPAAAIHRMLDSDDLPSQIYSVVDSSGALTSTPDELEEVMASHFESVFDLPDPEPEPPDPPAMLFEKPDIEPEWYRGLMDSVPAESLIALVADSPLVSAPGQDQVSVGVWKIAIQESELAREHIAQLFSRCIETSTFPAAWKTSIIHPLVKDRNKERAMSNIRPISLQSCLGKLFNKLLARRLGIILHSRPILNPSQRGFVLGGTTMKCIDELLDAWEWSRQGKRELHTLFYDVKQAYDSVQKEILIRAMLRLHLPQSFVDLVADSLTGLSSCVRTIYGLTRSFQVRRSLRQGDPLAPLLFVILMDGLHDGLEVNPVDGLRYGCTLSYRDAEAVYLPSLGYADDTTVLTNSLVDLRVQNDWVQYFMKFNRLRLNASKCELVGRIGALGESLDANQALAAHICVDGQPLVPLPHDKPIRYLGAHMCFDGDWRPQQNKALAQVNMFTRLASKFDLSIGHSVYMFNVFLMTRLELALHYVHGPGTDNWIEGLDRMVIGSIKHSCGSLLKLSHSAVARSLGLLLPSWLERAVKISEVFIRMNSSDQRWGRLGRISMREACHTTRCIDQNVPLSGPNARLSTQLTRAVYLAVKKLRWSLHLTKEARSESHRRHMFRREPVMGLPTLEHCSSSQIVQLGQAAAARGSIPQPRLSLAHDCWVGWYGDGVPGDPTIDVYTDGSHDPSTSTSSWSVVVGDQWLVDNFGSVPSDEQELARQPRVLGGSTMIGSAIKATQGIYPAELQAIARTLAIFPLGLSLCIHSDSQSSIQSIMSYLQEPNERRRLRSAARTILRLIAHLFRQRVEAGGDASFAHVRAHTDGMDQHSVGNRMADYQANNARQHAERSYPLGLREIPLEQLEQHLHIKDESGLVIIDDIRAVARGQLKSRAFDRWQAKLDKGDLTGQFAHVGTIDMGRVVLKHGSVDEQQTFVLVATNSIHYHRLPLAADGSTPLQQLQCGPCGQVLTVHHLMTCPEPSACDMRRELQLDILAAFSRFDECRDWLAAMSRVDFEQMIAALFPPPAAAVAADLGLNDHHVRCMIGAFTHSECLRAILSLGIEDPKHGLIAFRKFRCACLSQVAKFYASETQKNLPRH